MGHRHAVRRAQLQRLRAACYPPQCRPRFRAR